MTRVGRCGAAGHAVVLRIDNSSLEWRVERERHVNQPKANMGTMARGGRKGGYIVISAVKRYRTVERKPPRYVVG